MAFIKHDKRAIGSPTNDLRYTLSVESGETSDWFTFGNGVNQVNVDLIPEGTAKIQTTNDIEGLVNDPDNVVGIDWDDGAVSEATARVATGVVAFRVVSVSGAAEAHLNAVRA